MELAQITHLASEEPPFDLHPARAERLRHPLKTLLERIEQIAPELTAGGRT